MAIESWTTQTFSLSGRPDGQTDDVAALLRRLADQLEEAPDLTIRDIVFTTDLAQEGTFNVFTVYFDPDDN